MKYSIIALALFGAFNASADHNIPFKDKWFVNLGGTYADSEAKDLSGNEITDRDFGAWAGLGFSPNNNLSFEASYYDFGEISETLPALNIDKRVEASAYGLNGYARAFIGERFNVYASIGLHRVNVEQFDNQPSNNYFKDTESALSIGLGFEFFAYREFAIGVDFKRFNADSFDTDATSITFKYVF